MISAKLAKKVPDGFSLDVEFTLPPGVTALFGPPGAGKTLLIETLAGFVRPDSGRLLLDDVLLFDAAARVFVPPHRRECGYVAQRDALFPHMTLRRNLAFAAYRSPRVERARRVAEALDKFELGAVSENRPAGLTPAEKLRAAVARALLPWPRLLLLDERDYDEALLRKIREAFPGPILLATDDLELCCAAAERLALMDAGRIVRSGPPREVWDRPGSVPAARALGIPNIFECTISALDPGRHTSRLEFSGFSVEGPNMPGHFRGDRVWIAIRPEDLRVHAGGADGPGGIAVELLRSSPRLRAVRMEFSGGLFADMPAAEYEAKREAKSWRIEMPAEKVRVL
jgi:molybdate transport system ATP-binding protein